MTNPTRRKLTWHELHEHVCKIEWGSFADKDRLLIDFLSRCYPTVKVQNS